MQLSYYLKIYPFEERPGHSLLYSTKRASMVLLNNEKMAEISNNTLSSADKAALLNIGVITPDREEEKKEVSSMLDRINEKGSCLNITVVLNLDCNFACVYCYEGDLKGKLYMSEETADLLIEFIKEKFRPTMKYINIDFYGGEPLLSKELIKYISMAVKSFAEDNGVKYTSTITNNGSLFNGRIAEELKQLGLTGVKITLDGPAEIHNKYRPFKSGEGSFDTIIRNIKETCDIVDVGIGGNYDSESYEKFIPLLDYLKDEGLTPDRLFNIRFGPVMKGREGDLSLKDYSDGCMSASEPWVLKADVLLREEALKKGYKVPDIVPSPCQVEIKDYYIVNYDGALYKCPALIGKKEFEIGSLKEGVKDYSDSHKLGIYKNEECLECEYLPLCFGGCRYLAYLRDGNIDEPDCSKKPYFDASLETLIKQEIKYREKTVKESGS